MIGFAIVLGEDFFTHFGPLFLFFELMLSVHGLDCEKKANNTTEMAIKTSFLAQVHCKLVLFLLKSLNLNKRRGPGCC